MHMPGYFLWVAGLLLTVQPEKAPPPPKGSQQQADRLFGEKKWAEARTAYDALEQRAIEQAIECCLQMEEWDGALDRGNQFARIQKVEPFNRSWLHSSKNRAEDARR